MDISRASFIIYDLTEGNELRDLGLGEPYTNDEILEAAQIMQSSGLVGTAPGRVGRTVAYILSNQHKEMEG